jgi:hypothetical protein
VHPDLLVRLLLELTESTYALAVFHPNFFADHPDLCQQVSDDAFAGVTVTGMTSRPIVPVVSLALSVAGPLFYPALT